VVAQLGGAESPYKGWERWAGMLGFRGHFATKSRRYSITLGRLRQARRDYTRRHHQLREQSSTQSSGWTGNDDVGEEQGETTLVIGSWRFAGMGWLTTADAALALASAVQARDAPGPSGHRPSSSTRVRPRPEPPASVGRCRSPEKGRR
jgi:hypothetical protein